MGEQVPWRPAVHWTVMGNKVLRVKVAFWRAECMHWPAVMLVFHSQCTVHSSAFIDSNLWSFRKRLWVNISSQKELKTHPVLHKHSLKLAKALTWVSIHCASKCTHYTSFLRINISSVCQQSPCLSISRKSNVHALFPVCFPSGWTVQPLNSSGNTFGFNPSWPTSWWAWPLPREITQPLHLF